MLHIRPIVKYTRQFLVWFLLGVALGLGAGSLGRESIEAAGSARIFISPQEINLPGEGRVVLNIDSGETEVGFVKVELGFDPTLVRLDDEATIGGQLSSVVTKTEMNAANETGNFILVVALPPERRSEAPSGQWELVNLKFVAATEAANIMTNLTINSESVQIVGLDETELVAEIENGIFYVNVVQPTPTLVVGKGARMWLLGEEEASLGNEWKVKLELESEKNVSGVDAVVTYDPDMLEALRFDDWKLLSGQTEYVNETNGKIRISQTMPVGSGWSGTGTLGELIFRTKNLGKTDLGWDFTPGVKSESNVIAIADGSDVLLEVVGVKVTIANNLRVRFGLSTASENAPLGFKVKGLFEDGVGWSEELETDTDGMTNYIEGQTGWIGGQKRFTVKVDGYLNKAADVTLGYGDQTVNLGQLVAGDMNNDGIVNNIDLSLLYDGWFKNGVGDYNLDGIVNSADHWILISNFLAVDD